MFGLTAVVFWMSCLGLGLVVVVFHPTGLGLLGWRWGHLDLLLPCGRLGLDRCVLYDSVLGPLQSVQRAELWGLYWLLGVLLLFIWVLTI